ncbi:MAG: hydantoinase B/oxoprolinase family protein [Alphaproteobacteria bacterium]|jgi:N-methylhydantoinase B|nr:hydantoinase B/oxoprolinase family protein [Alphaproteobacteria bacterium]
MTEGSAVFDAVTLEVLWTRLISTVDEAAKAIVRTSFSNLSNEANDFACVLTDSRGQLIAQNSGAIPSFIGTLPATVRHFLDAFGADGFRPGDILSTNNPWQGTGHLNDVCIVKPIFMAERLIAFSATTAHVPDIGGRIRSMVAREVYEEGFHIPLMKIVNEGRPDETFFHLLRTQVRTPDQTEGDIQAQMSANALMENRLLGLMAEYGLDEVDALSDELNGRCETAMRAAIRGLADGDYEYELRTDGIRPEAPFVFKLKLTIRDDSAHFDFTGTSPVQPRSINCPYCYTFAMSAYAIKCALLPELPNNAGMLRPLSVFAPENSLLNPLPPAAVGGRANTGHYVPVVVFGALAEALPNRVMAGAGSPLWNCTQSGVAEDGRPYTSVLFMNGGMGATISQDGENTLSWPSNISATPVEVAERISPFFVHHKRLTPGSGGAGRHRGGLGQEMSMISESKTPITVTFLGERTRIPAPGFAGGGTGGLGAVIINGENVDTREMYYLEEGDSLVMRTPGGGGYGAETEREPARSARDSKLGYLD